MRGISGVVVAVLLTVIGVVAVLVFWTGVICSIAPQLCGRTESKVMIESASLVKMGNNYLLTVHVREVGGASTTIETIKLIKDNPDSPVCSDKPNKLLEAGRSATIQKTCGNLNPGETYYVIVEYKSGGTTKVTDPYPVTAR